MKSKHDLLELIKPLLKKEFNYWKINFIKHKPNEIVLCLYLYIINKKLILLIKN